MFRYESFTYCKITIVNIAKKIGTLRYNSGIILYGDAMYQCCRL